MRILQAVFTDISTLPGHLSAGHAVQIEILNILAALSGHLVALAASGFRLAVDWAPPGFGGCLWSPLRWTSRGLFLNRCRTIRLGLLTSAGTLLASISQSLAPYGIGFLLPLLTPKPTTHLHFSCIIPATASERPRRVCSSDATVRPRDVLVT